MCSWRCFVDGAHDDAGRAGRLLRLRCSTRFKQKRKLRECTCAACTTCIATPPPRPARCVQRPRVHRCARIVNLRAGHVLGCASSCSQPAVRLTRACFLQPPAWLRAVRDYRHACCAAWTYGALTFVLRHRGDHVPPEVGSGFSTGYSYVAPVVRSSAHAEAAPPTRVSLRPYRSACKAI